MTAFGGNTAPYPPVQNGKEKRGGLILPADFARLLTAAERAKLAALTQTHFQVTGNTNAAVVTATFTTVLFATEVFDTNNEYTPATGVFVPAQTGIYTVSAFCAFVAKPANIRQVTSVFINGAEARRLYDDTAGFGGLDIGGGGAITLALNAGDSVTIRALHNNAGNLTLVNNAPSCWLSVTRLS